MPDNFKPEPYSSSNGVIRPSPLVKAMAAQKTAASATPTHQGTGNGVTANRAVANPNVTNPNGDLPEGVSEADVAAAVAKAEQGDQAAIDWLKTLGLVAGTAAGGYILLQALKKRKTPQSMGADNIAVDAATPNAQSAVAKKPRKVDLYVDLEADAVKRPEGYLPGPGKGIVAAQPPNPPKPRRLPKPNAVEDLTRAIKILP